MSKTIQTQLRDGRVSRKIDEIWLVEIPVTVRESAADYIDKLEKALRQIESLAVGVGTFRVGRRVRKAYEIAHKILDKGK